MKKLKGLFGSHRDVELRNDSTQSDLRELNQPRQGYSRSDEVDNCSLHKSQHSRSSSTVSTVTSSIQYSCDSSAGVTTLEGGVTAGVGGVTELMIACQQQRNSHVKKYINI